MISYLVSSAFCLILLLAVYHILLEEEKMHKFKRIYLLFSLIASLVTPLLTFEATRIIMSEGLINHLAVIDPVQLAVDVTGTGTNSDSFIYTAILIYVGIVLMLLARFIYNLKLIQLKARWNNRMLSDDAVLVLLQEETVPYSFLNFIFLNKQAYREGRINKEILVHEKAHIRQKHSLDILFVELLKIIFWFNPVFYFYKKAIQLNHEFLADEAVVSNTDSISKYQALILKNSLPRSQFSIVCNLGFSTIKKRMLMINHHTTPARSVCKQLGLIPVVTAVILLSGCITDQHNNTTFWTDDTISLEISDARIVKINGEEVHISQLDHRLSDIVDSSDPLISLSVNPDTPFGTITDVQSLLREQGALRINYSVKTGRVE